MLGRGQTFVSCKSAIESAAFGTTWKQCEEIVFFVERNPRRLKKMQCNLLQELQGSFP